MAAAEEKSEQLGGVLFPTVQRPSEDYEFVGKALSKKSLKENCFPHSFRFFMFVLLLPGDLPTW